MITVGIVGASGYTGGEALRILLRHPGVEVVQATSESNAGHFVHTIHPNFRKQSQLKFTSINELKPCEVLF
ncbi:MAG: N-acetyl-gamma-glutamyl-phosphate reductase, partial [candidate division NC10 bacterium]|nr:N-acetyl-gamma-glutamyl-phosphate reductase [candidate division NC10 bacterium]